MWEVVLISSALFIVTLVCLFLKLVDPMDNLPWLLLIIVVVPSLFVFGGYILSFQSHLFQDSGARLFAYFCALYLAGWIYVSIPVSHFSFSKDRYCKMEFHQWLTGRCVLSYYENSVCVGTVRLHSDLLNNPVAFFPGMDGESVVCFSYLDTTWAAFTVDFTKQDNNGVVIPERLRDPGQEAVDRSDFEVRACTRKEVNFVEQYIKTVDSNTLSNLVIRGSTAPETRRNLLTFLVMASDMKPQMPPEN